MAQNIILLTRAKSRYDAVSTINDLTDDWCRHDPDYRFYWAPLQRSGEMTREQLIEAAVRPAAELSEEILGMTDHLAAYDDDGHVIRFANHNSRFAPPFPPLAMLLARCAPTWVGFMQYRVSDPQDTPREPKNNYIYLHPDERLFVMHKPSDRDTDREVVVEECTIIPADGRLKINSVTSLSSDEVCNLTSDGTSLLEGFQRQNEARLRDEGSGVEQGRGSNR